MVVGNTQRPGTRENASARMSPLCCQHRSPPAGHSEAPPYRARLAAAIAAVTSIVRWIPHSQARWASVLALVAGFDTAHGHDPALPLSYTRKVVGAARSTSGGDGTAAAYRSRRSARRRTPSVLRLHQHRSGPGLIPARLSLPFLACHAGVCSPRVPSHVHSCCVSFNAAASMLALGTYAAWVTASV